MSRLYQDTKQAFTGAIPFGITGTLLGAGLGALIQFVDNDTSSLQQYGKMSALTAVTVGAIFQVGGMMYVNKTMGGAGIYATPISATAGFVGGVSWSKFKHHHSDVKGVMKYGLVGMLTGAVLGAPIDYLRN